MIHFQDYRMKAKEIYLGLWMFLACDCFAHKPLADGLHKLCLASPSMEHSYLDICYLAVAAHGGLDIGANQYLTGCGCKMGNRDWLAAGTEVYCCCMHTLCLHEVR